MGKSPYSGWFNFIENYWFNRCIALSNLRSYQMLQSINWHCLVAVILLSSQGDTCCKITNASNGWVESIRGRCFRITSGTRRGKLPLKCEWMLLPSQEFLLFITYNFPFPQLRCRSEKNVCNGGLVRTCAILAQTMFKRNWETWRMKRHRNEPIKDQYRVVFNHLIGVGKALVKRKEILHENRV